MPDNDEYLSGGRFDPDDDQEPTAPQVVASSMAADGYAVWEDDSLDDAGDSADDYADGADDAWPRPSDRKGVRMRLPSVVLLALLIAAGGFWGGAVVQKHDGTSATPSASSLASAARRAFAPSSSAGRGGSARAGGFPGGGGGIFSSGGATVGEVTAIKGSTLYVTTSTGKLVKVAIGSSTTITENAKTTLSGLKAGDSVVVTGSTAKNGTVTARSVAATQQGLSPAAGGGF